MTHPEPLKMIPAEAVSADLVTTIEAVLERAKAGELSSVAIAFVTREGRVNSRSSTPPNYAALLGAVSHMAFEMAAMKEDLL